MSSASNVLQVFAKKIENIEKKLSNINIVNPQPVPTQASQVDAVSANDLKHTKEEMLSEMKGFIENYVTELMEKEMNNIKQGMMRVITMKIEQNMKVKLDDIKQEIDEIKKSNCDNNLNLLDEIKKINGDATAASSSLTEVDEAKADIVVVPPPQSAPKKTRKSRSSNVTTKRELEI